MPIVAKMVGGGGFLNAGVNLGASLPGVQSDVISMLIAPTEILEEFWKHSA